MKISIATIAAVAAASAPGALAQQWQCNGNWNDGGLHRLSWIYQGYCTERAGQCFLDVIRGLGVTVHNWQSWDRGDGWWQADMSTTAGLAWQVNNGIAQITGTNLGCWPNQ